MEFSGKVQKMGKFATSAFCTVAIQIIGAMKGERIHILVTDACKWDAP